MLKGGSYETYTRDQALARSTCEWEKITYFQFGYTDISFEIKLMFPQKRMRGKIIKKLKF